MSRLTFGRVTFAGFFGVWIVLSHQMVRGLSTA